MSELAALATVPELAARAAAAIAAVNELTQEDEPASVTEIHDSLVGLELMSDGLPRLCEQFARRLTVLQEDGVLGGPAEVITELHEALIAAGRAADMLTAALDQARSTFADLG